MEDDDKRNLYEVTELQQYEDGKGEYFDTHTYQDNKSQNASKYPLIVYVLMGILVVIGIIQIILLAVTAATLATGSCDTSTTSGALTGSDNDLNQLRNDMQEQTRQMINATQYSAMMITEYINKQTAGSRNSSARLEWKIEDIHSFIEAQGSTFLNTSNNNTERILQVARDSADKLMGIVNTLSNLQDTSTSTAGVTNDILLVAQQLLVLQNDSTALPTSCKEIKERQPSSPSGVYILMDINGAGSYETYCNMGNLCGSGGGWTRLAYLDMSDATQNCPSGLRMYQDSGVRACGRPATSIGNCASQTFSSHGISYSEICGKVIGYQYRSTDASVSSNINSNYVDGVSITRGSPRQHVWTLVSGWSDSYNINPCRCNGPPQAFVGNNYYCESGNPTNNADGHGLFTADPLWDGQNCGSYETACCTPSDLPWFHRDYGSTSSTDNIEMRVCGNEATSNEDVTVGLYEIYIK